MKLLTMLLPLIATVGIASIVSARDDQDLVDEGIKSMETRPCVWH
jgi:hypothetical protein